MHAHRPTARRVLGALAGFVTAILVWHALVSLLVWKPTGYRDHPDLGRIYRPGVYVHGTEGFSWSRINSLGMRSPEVGPKRTDVMRILFLGDSFTEAFQVRADRAFPVRTEALLKSRGVNAETVNAGRSGASPATYLALGDWYVERIRPDVVVVQLSEEDLTSDLTNPGSNFYLAEVDGGYEARMNREFRSATPLAQRYPLVRGALEWPLVRVAGENTRKMLLAQRLSAQASRSDSDEDSQAPQSGEADPALAEWLMTEIAATYDDPVVVFLPSVDYETDPEAQGRAERLLEQAASRHGVRFVDIRPDVAKAFADDASPSHGFANSRLPDSGGHLNAVGHEIVAERLADVLARQFAR